MMLAVLVRCGALCALSQAALRIRMSRDWKTKQRTIHDPNTMTETETITVRSYYGDHDRQVVLSAAIEQTTDASSGQTITRATLDRMTAAQRTLAVIGWTLLDEDGAPLPFTTENLLNLPTEVAAFVDAEIQKDWGSLVATAQTPEEAEQAAKEEREERSTFPGASVPANGRAGKAVASGRHERAREGVAGVSSAEDAH